MSGGFKKQDKNRPAKEGSDRDELLDDGFGYALAALGVVALAFLVYIAIHSVRLTLF